jgi:hypothetical protein
VLTDPAGNVYVTGWTTQTGFPISADAYQTTRFGNDEVYVTRLDALLSTAVLTGAPQVSGEVRTGSLLEAFPNPFRPQTEIAFTLPTARQAELAVYNVAGERVAVLADRRFAEGRHTLTWEGQSAAGRQLPAGVYLVRLDAGDLTDVRKITRLR